MAGSNLLVVHQGALGDFILTFPALTRLQKYYKPIDVICQNQFGKLAGSLGLADNWFPAEAAPFASLFSDRVDPKMKALLRRYGKVILFTLSEQLVEAVERVTTNLSCRLPPKPPAHERIHVAKFALENILNCGLITKEDSMLEDLPLPIRDVRRTDPHKILLHPAAGSIRKRWPLSNFLKVEAALKANGLMPQFILGPAEGALAEKLLHPDRRVQILDDLLQLLDLYRGAGGYIGNDSGASHLAAYCGLPTTVIFGPADPMRWTPIGRAVQIIRPGLECRPCFETDPTNCDGLQCLAGTSPQTVLVAFYRLYSNRQLDTSVNTPEAARDEIEN